MNKQDFLKKMKNIPEVEPDKEDLEAINRINANEYNGRISLRVPKSLHADLIGKAKNEGISLNQYIVYKLAK